MYIRNYEFAWDPDKAGLNLEKHGVSFEEALTVFLDGNGLDWEDLEHSAHEPRLKRLGKSESGEVLMVVYTMRRGSHDEEVIRIISARKASRRERQAYARP